MVSQHLYLAASCAIAIAALTISGCQSPPKPTTCENHCQSTGEGVMRKERRSVAADGSVTIVQVLVLADGREVEDGPSKSWNRDGKRLCEGSYENGKRQGVWRYWRRDGRLRKLETYRDGQYDGVILDWDEQTNELLEAKIIVQDYPDSIWITFHRNNIPSLIQTYKREVGHTGVSLWFHEWGMPERFAEYKNDKLNGTSVEWDKDGNRTKVEKYKDDVKEK